MERRVPLLIISSLTFGGRDAAADAAASDAHPSSSETREEEPGIIHINTYLALRLSSSSLAAAAAAGAGDDYDSLWILALSHSLEDQAVESLKNRQQ